MKKEMKGNNQRGKGSKRRKEDFRKILTRWDFIKGFKKSRY